MSTALDSPLVVFAVSLVVQWLSAYLGYFLRRERQSLSKDAHDDFDTVQTASLTLLALIIGFSFSMAVTRYDQRKNYEEAEANAIGTEYLRADLLPVEDAARVRELLKAYLDQRISFYQDREERQVSQIDSDTAKLQVELWSSVFGAADQRPTAVVALAVSGMNDVLNSQGYTQSGMVEPHTHCGMGVDGTDGNLQQLAARLWRASKKHASASCTAGNHFDRVFAYCRYRQPARRDHSRPPAQPDCFVSINKSPVGREPTSPFVAVVTLMKFLPPIILPSPWHWRTASSGSVRLVSREGAG
jgi:hypothetical protein